MPTLSLALQRRELVRKKRKKERKGEEIQRWMIRNTHNESKFKNRSGSLAHLNFPQQTQTTHVLLQWSEGRVRTCREKWCSNGSHLFSNPYTTLHKEKQLLRNGDLWIFSVVCKYREPVTYALPHPVKYVFLQHLSSTENTSESVIT